MTKGEYQTLAKKVAPLTKIMHEIRDYMYDYNMYDSLMPSYDHIREVWGKMHNRLVEYQYSQRNEPKDL